MLLSFGEKIDTDYSDMKDKEILSLSIDRPDAFGVLVDRYEKALTRKAYSILNNREEAEDVVQEAFTKVYLNASKFRDMEGASFNSWIYKILINTTLTRYQKVKKKWGQSADIPQEIYVMLPDMNERDFEKKELYDYVASVFTRMPKHFSRVLTLHFLQGKSQLEIAEEEEISLSAVKTRVYRAKKAFREANSNI